MKAAKKIKYYLWLIPFIVDIANNDFGYIPTYQKKYNRNELDNPHSNIINMYRKFFFFTGFSQNGFFSFIFDGLS